MHNYRETAKEILADIKANGYRGVPCHTELEGEDDPIPDEETVEEKTEFNKNYAIFIVEPQFAYCFNEHEYVEVNVTKFYNDLIRYFHEKFPDSKITHYEKCCEFEVMNKPFFELREKLKFL